MFLERRGIPTATVVTHAFDSYARGLARMQGMAALPIVVIPHPIAARPRGRAAREGEEGSRGNPRGVEPLDGGLVKISCFPPTAVPPVPPSRAKASPPARQFGVDDSLESIFEIFDLYYEKGWTDGLPIYPPTRSGGRRHAALHRPRARRRGRGRSSAQRRGDGGEDRHQRGHGGLPARVPAGADRRGRGHGRARVQPLRPADHHASRRPPADRERSAAARARRQLQAQRLRAGLACQRHDGARAAPDPHQYRRQQARRDRHGDARPPGEVLVLHGRGRGGEPVGAAARRARARPGDERRDRVLRGSAAQHQRPGQQDAGDVPGLGGVDHGHAGRERALSQRAARRAGARHQRRKREVARGFRVERRTT